MKFSKNMLKKLFCCVLIMMSLVMTGCVATDAVIVSETRDIVYMDIGNRYAVVYINGVPNYRFWDVMYSRYYYRPVPRHRYRYIGRPVRVRPPRNPRYYDTRPQFRHHATPVPDRISPQPRPDNRMRKTTPPVLRGRGSFDGIR